MFTQIPSKCGINILGEKSDAEILKEFNSLGKSDIPGKPLVQLIDPKLLTEEG